MKHRIRILYVDSNGFFSRTVIRCLVRAQYAVTHYCADTIALSQCTPHFDFDIVIIGVEPTTNLCATVQFSQRIYEHAPYHIPIVALINPDRLPEFLSRGIRYDDTLIRSSDHTQLLYAVKAFSKICCMRKSGVLLSRKIASLNFDFSRLTISPRNGEGMVKMSAKEAEILFFLCQNSNKKVKKSTVLKQVYGSIDYYYARSMDVYIYRLQKIFQKLDGTIKIHTFTTSRCLIFPLQPVEFIKLITPN